MSMGDTRAAPESGRESLWHLLYRYLWPFQYFRDVTRGGVAERRWNYLHNRARRRYLPGFLIKWSILCALWFALGRAMADLGAVYIAAGCFVTWTWSVVVVVNLGVGWLWLARFPEL